MDSYISLLGTDSLPALLAFQFHSLVLAMEPVAATLFVKDIVHQAECLKMERLILPAFSLKDLLSCILHSTQTVL